ncbi:MAG: class I SAM-dependent methyltransferase [Acidimicrobiales bacterium]
MDYPRLYEYRFRDVDQSARQAVWDQVGPWLWARMGHPGRVLDVAAGRGELLASLPAGTERWAVDQIDPQLGPGVKCLVGDVMSVELPEGYFDGVFVSNLLEHLATQEDVFRLLVRLRAAMAPGGTLCVMGPNFRYCAREYFDCADHTLALTHVSVAEHLYAAGFEGAEVTARFLPYSFRGRLPASAALVERYLASPWAWPLLGRQFLALARR